MIIRLCGITKPEGSLDDGLVRLTILRTFRRFCKLERNKGMRYAPDAVDWDMVFENIKEYWYNVINVGRKIKIHNHL